jgi:hypothetical protein
MDFPKPSSPKNEKPLGSFTLPKSSEELQALYKRFPALNQLVETNYWLGLFRGLVEMAVSTRLYMNLPEVGILSMLTGYSFNTPGEYFAEMKATQFVGQKVDPLTPTNKVKAIKKETVQFIGVIWETREALESLLQKEHFKTPAQFETSYLQNVDKINAVLKKGLEPDEQASQLATILFGEGKPVPQDQTALMELLRNQKSLLPEAIEQALREFYGKISGITPPVAVKDRLWTRGRYADLVKGLTSVVEHGYYEEMDEELLMLKGAESALKDVKAGRKLSHDDIEDLDSVTREYLAFLLTNQWLFHEGEESLSTVSKALESVGRKQKLEPKIKQHLKTLIDSYVESIQIAQRMHGANGAEAQRQMALVQGFLAEGMEGEKSDPNETLGLLRDYVAILNEVYTVQGKSTWEQRIKGLRSILADIPKGKFEQAPIFDELGQYTDSRRRAMRAAGVAEKKIHMPLATARDRFLDAPVQQHTREVNQEELDAVMGLCFGLSKKTKRNEILSHAALYGMLGLSILDPGIFGGKIASALGWGAPIGTRTFVESYNVTKGGRVMSNAVAQIFVNGFPDKKVNVAALINEHDSRSSQAYNRGFFMAMAGSLSTVYGGEMVGMPWLGYAPVLASAIPFALAYRKWFKSIEELKEQIYKNVGKLPQPQKNPPENPAPALPTK